MSIKFYHNNSLFDLSKLDSELIFFQKCCPISYALYDKSQKLNCFITNNLLAKNKIFTDKTFDRNEILDYCETLFNNPPITLNQDIKFDLRYYQHEAINLIKNNNKNLAILY